MENDSKNIIMIESKNPDGSKKEEKLIIDEVTEPISLDKDQEIKEYDG